MSGGFFGNFISGFYHLDSDKNNSIFQIILLGTGDFLLIICWQLAARLVCLCLFFLAIFVGIYPHHLLEKRQNARKAWSGMKMKTVNLFRQVSTSFAVLPSDVFPQFSSQNFPSFVRLNAVHL